MSKYEFVMDSFDRANDSSGLGAWSAQGIAADVDQLCCSVGGTENSLHSATRSFADIDTRIDAKACVANSNYGVTSALGSMNDSVVSIQSEVKSLKDTLKELADAIGARIDDDYTVRLVSKNQFYDRAGRLNRSQLLTL